MQGVAVILAAGSSRRLGQPKPFVKLGKQMLLERVLTAFDRHPRIGRTVIVCRKQDLKKTVALVERLELLKPSLIVTGGATRQESCFNALHVLKRFSESPDTPVLVHNVANPSVESGDITRVLRLVKRRGAVAVGRPVTDTIKEVGRAGLVAHTLPRGNLWATQTPQCMTLGTALRAHALAKKQKHIGTDDVELVERLREPVTLIPTSEQNFKITSPLSLKIARTLH